MASSLSREGFVDVDSQSRAHLGKAASTDAASAFGFSARPVAINSLPPSPLASRRGSRASDDTWDLPDTSVESTAEADATSPNGSSIIPEDGWLPSTTGKKRAGKKQPALAEKSQSTPALDQSMSAPPASTQTAIDDQTPLIAALRAEVGDVRKAQSALQEELRKAQEGERNARWELNSERTSRRIAELEASARETEVGWTRDIGDENGYSANHKLSERTSGLEKDNAAAMARLSTLEAQLREKPQATISGHPSNIPYSPTPYSPYSPRSPHHRTRTQRVVSAGPIPSPNALPSYQFGNGFYPVVPIQNGFLSPHIVGKPFIPHPQPTMYSPQSPYPHSAPHSPVPYPPSSASTDNGGEHLAGPLTPGLPQQIYYEVAHGSNLNLSDEERRQHIADSVLRKKPAVEGQENSGLGVGELNTVPNSFTGLLQVPPDMVRGHGSEDGSYEPSRTSRRGSTNPTSLGSASPPVELQIGEVAEDDDIEYAPIFPSLSHTPAQLAEIARMRAAFTRKSSSRPQSTSRRGSVDAEAKNDFGVREGGLMGPIKAGPFSSPAIMQREPSACTRRAMDDSKRANGNLSHPNGIWRGDERTDRDDDDPVSAEISSLTDEERRRERTLQNGGGPNPPEPATPVTGTDAYQERGVETR